MSDNLTPRQRKAIEALLISGTVSEAAHAAGVSRDSLYRWQKQPAFRDALREGKRQALESLALAMVGLAGKATKAINDALEDEGRYPMSRTLRLKAADVLLGRLPAILETHEFEARLTALEKKDE